jgi:hypothetical protein
MSSCRPGTRYPPAHLGEHGPDRDHLSFRQAHAPRVRLSARTTFSRQSPPVGDRSCAQLIYCFNLLIEILTQWILNRIGYLCEIVDAQLFDRVDQIFEGFR